MFQRNGGNSLLQVLAVDGFARISASLCELQELKQPRRSIPRPIEQSGIGSRQT